MGERGANPDESPTLDELTEMARLTRAGIDAGALGFTTSRTHLHRTATVRPLGTRYSSADELTAIASALTDAKRGVLQMISDAYLTTDPEFAADEFALMRTLVEATGRPLSMTVQQPDDVPDRWREIIDFVGRCAADGLPMRAQVAPRPIGVLQGLSSSINPFAVTPSYREIAKLPLAERVRLMSDPERKARILQEHEARIDGILGDLTQSFHKLYPLTDPVNYEPEAASSIQGLANATGRRPAEVAYDILLEHDGNQLLYMPLMNYVAGNLDDVREMLLSPVRHHGPLRRRRPLRRHLRRQLPHHDAVALGSRAAPAARSCRSSCWCTTSRSAPPRTSVGSTAASWRPATWPT